MLGKVNGNGRPSLGVLPIGPGNDFAFGVGIPLELEDAVRVLAAGSGAPSTLAAFLAALPGRPLFCQRDRHGLRETVVGFEAEKIKRLKGAASYLVAWSHDFSVLEGAGLRGVVLDNGTLNQPFLMISVMNGRRMGALFIWPRTAIRVTTPSTLPGRGCAPDQNMPLAAKFLKRLPGGSPVRQHGFARRKFPCARSKAPFGSR